MKNYSAFWVALGASLCVSIGASAQDNGSDNKQFSGFYVGTGGGYADYGDAGSGGYGEVFAGLRKQTDSGLVYGIEGVAGLVDASGLQDENVIIDLDGYAAILAKVGYATNNKTLVYGGLGYTSVDVVDAEDDDGSSGGVLVEAGFEYAATSWLGIRLRGQYHAVSDDADITSIGAALNFTF